MADDMQWSDRFAIGDRAIGREAPCFVIAEAGSNHNGSLESALALIDVAADAGADAVKFQVFRAARMYPRNAGISDYLKSPRAIYDIIADMEMPYEWIPQLAEQCRRRSVEFLATPFDEAAVAVLAPHVNAFKIASYELTHAPLVNTVAQHRKPIVISTGAADASEVGAALRVLHRAGARDVVVLQCTAAYPAPMESLNLRAIVAMRREFGVLTGLSDHSREPVVAPLVALGLGAVLIEKHFTLSNQLPGPDHRFALEPGELRDLVRAVRQGESALGMGEKRHDAVEEELRAFARRAVFALRDIQAGEPFTADNIAVLRRGKQPDGLAPGEYPRLIGRAAARRIARDRPLTAEDVG